MGFKIWQRYFFRQTLKVFGLILGCFYGLYVLVDFANRSGSQNHFHSKFQLLDFFKYYLFEFVQRLDVFLPFALLIATIRTLTLLNVQNELVALQASGIKTKALVRPFLFLGLCGVAIMFVNFQYLIPRTLEEMRHMHDSHALRSNKKKRKKITVQSIPLKDNSTLLFQEYDPLEEVFFDVYWIKSFDEIYHMKYLSPNSKTPLGTYVEYLARNQEGAINKIASYDTKEFPTLKFNKKILLDTITPPEELSISKLWQKLPPLGIPSSDKEAQLAAAFYQKLVIPWLCLLAVLGPAPYCLRFSRYFPVFMIYGIGIFILAACYIMIDAAVVIGGRQVSSPFMALLIPFLIIQLSILWSYLKLK